jgi:acyl carrier protein
LQEDQIFQRVRRKVKEIFAVEEDKITLGTNYKEDLGAKSLDLITLMLELEDVFSSEISDVEAEKLTTVGETVALIKNKFINLNDNSN